jgi:hypothetical protein
MTEIPEIKNSVHAVEIVDDAIIADSQPEVAAPGHSVVWKSLQVQTHLVDTAFNAMLQLRR